LRMKRLWEKPEGESPSVSQKGFEDAKVAYEKARAQHAQALAQLSKAKINLEETAIKAPFNGVVTLRFVDPGEVVTGVSTAPLLKTKALDPFYLNFNFSKRKWKNIKIGSSIFFEGEGTRHETGTAKIERIFPAMEEKTRSIKCRAIL